MRKRSRKRSRRRSSRRNHRGGGLSRRIGFAMIVGLLGVGAWLFIGDDDNESAGEDRIGVQEVNEVNSPEAIENRKQSDRALLAEASSLSRTYAGLNGQERRDAETQAYERFVEILELSMQVKTRQKIAEQFNTLTDSIFFGPERNSFNTVYIVKSGDSLARIANAYNTTQELLCEWNGIAWESRARINIGQSLKIVEGAPRIVVDKSDYCLSYYFGDRLARQFIIAHGRNNGTPTGDVTVMNKVVDPDLGPNTADNHREMDERWIGLTNFGQRTGIGIHGTKHQDQIPGETSAGCIRMYNADVIKLDAWTPLGTKVQFKS